MNQKEIAPFDIKELTENNIALMQSQCEEMIIDEKGKGYVEVKAAHVKVKGLKRAVFDRHKELKADILEKSQSLDAERRRLFGLLDPIIETLAQKRQVEDDRKAEIRAAKQRKEQDRINGIRAKIDGIKQWCYQGIGYGVPSQNIKSILPLLKETMSGLTEDDYMEFLTEAQGCLSGAINETEKALEARLQMEKELEEAKAEAERLAEIKKQQEAEQEKIDAAKREIEKEKAKIETEKRERKIKEEARREAKEKLEREAQEAEERKAAEIAEKARFEALRPDKEKLLLFAQALHDMEWPEVKDDSMAQVIIKAKQVVWAAIEILREDIK